jgi:nucleoside-diphosphate-sugar epimerase
MRFGERSELPGSDQMKRVVVTGGSGFIGRFTLPLLVEAGFEVHALSRSGGPGISDGVSWHAIDLMDYPSVDNLLQELKASHLLHLAWYTEHGKFWNAPENLDWVASSLNLVKSFVEQGGGRVLISGSCAEYDWSKGHCIEQLTPCRPATLYGSSKDALHRITAAFCALNQVGFAWGRIFFLYGPNESGKRFVPAVIKGLLNHEVVPCSDGSQLRDFMHVQDVASAFVCLLQSDLGGAVNISTGESHTLREIGGEITSLIKSNGRIEFGALPNRGDDPAVLTADVSRLRDEMGWQPTFSLSQGLADTIKWRVENMEQEDAC